MDRLEGKTAVVTGAASGMGLAFARRFAAAGMNVVLADIEAPALDEAVAGITGLGGDALGVVTDVSDGASMDALATAAFDRFGRVNVVCNNAGVGGTITSGPTRIDPADWQWVLGVNLWGVIHGHRVFLPHLVEHGDGHVVNTASIAGQLPAHSAYHASKFAVVALTEGLYYAMRTAGTGVGVSCLCPGYVRTRIASAHRNRPEWAAPSALTQPDPVAEQRMALLAEAIDAGMAPDDVAELVHDAIMGDRFWIFTDHRMVAALEERFHSILENRNPEPVNLLSPEREREEPVPG